MRQSRLYLVALALFAALLLAGCNSTGSAKSSTTTSSTLPSSTSAPENGTSGAALQEKARASALKKGWAHIDIAMSQGDVSGTYSQDSGPTSGHQSITVGGNMNAEVIYVNDIAYIKGNANAVVGFFGYPPAQAPQLADKWIALKSTDAGYDDAKTATTLESALDELELTGNLTVGSKTKLDGVDVTGVTGTFDAPGFGEVKATLYVTADDEALPVQLKIADGEDISQTVKFSKWGQAVSITAPAGAIPGSSVDTVPSQT